MLCLEQAERPPEWEAEETALWEAEGQHGIGYVRADFDPASGRRSQLWLTSAAARHYGLHQEEVRSSCIRLSLSPLALF